MLSPTFPAAKRVPAALLAILLLAVGLRLHHLGTTSLWTDELFTRYYPRLGLGFLWGEGRTLEPTPPLYYSVILGWTALVGDGAFALRLPSVAGSMLGIVLAYLLARELLESPRAWLLAPLLLALTPTSIFYAQEARTYALQGAAIALAMLGFARYLRAPGKSALALYVVGAVLAIHLHLTSALFVAAVNLAALASLAGPGRLLDRTAFLRWCAANALVALACLPLLPILLSPVTVNATTWIGPTTRWSVERTFAITLLGPAVQDNLLFYGEIGFVVVAALALLPPWRPGRRALTVLAAVPLIFIVLIVGISFGKPVLITRTAAWLCIPLALVLGDILARRFRLLAVAGIGLACAAAALHVARVDGLKEDWKGLLQGLPGLAPPALVVLAPHTPPGAVADYAPGAGQPERIAGDFAPTIETTTIPAMFGTPTLAPDALAAAIAQGRPVWLLVRRPDYDWLEQLLAGLPPPRANIPDGPGRNPALRAVGW